MKVSITCVAIGGWYPRGLTRMVHKFAELTPHEKWIGPNFRILPWLNAKPPGTPNIIEGGYDYTPYAAKPHALFDAINGHGADIAILLDASFWPVRDITPLIDHVADRGYYLCRNGYSVGQWATDRCLAWFNWKRDYAMHVPDVSSYCVGIHREHTDAMRALQDWCDMSVRETIAGPHENQRRGGGRNPGWCSDDPRCLGHRHDQTVLSIVAHARGLNELTCRPKFTAYKGCEDETTVLVCEGMAERFPK